ncbi:hypothetical protein TWF718_005341 [Orbilia javanica]|uniref:Uncharacterized protein n=1 Tax=Orbilia javanica TaxID=47235 RepID=A0AAN8RDH6_9PEZI
MFSVPRNIQAGLKDDVIKILVSNVKAPEDLAEDVPLIEGTETVSSYNWLAEHEVECDVPTIQVPGAPPILHLHASMDSMQLQPDSGTHFIDQNASRMKGKSGLIPGLAACYAYKKDFDITDYDVVTDRNNLIKLFELIELSAVETKDEGRPPTSTPWRAPSIAAAASRRARGGMHSLHPAFQKLGSRRGGGIESMDRRAEKTRIDVDIVSGYNHETGEYIYDDKSPKQTLVLTRWEYKNEEVVDPATDFRGFGHSFLTETRRFLSFEEGRVNYKGPDDVTGFHCLVGYKLFGMKLLVRYHADACDMTREQFIKWISEDAIRDLSDPETDSGSDSEEGSEDNTLCESPTTDTFDLLDAFKTLSVKTEDTSRVSHVHHSSTGDNADGATLPKIPMGIVQTPNTIFPADRILQVKTRGIKTGLNREVLFRQLFFSQTRKVFVAYHSRGLFVKENRSQEDIMKEMTGWAKDNKEIFKKLVSLFMEIKNKVGRAGGKGAVGFLLKKNASDDPVVLDIQSRTD